MMRIYLASSSSKSSVIVLLTLLVVTCFAAAENGGAPSSDAMAPRRLITQSVDAAQLTVLKGNTHPLARAEFDQGPAPATLAMQRMILVLKRSPEQESALRKLLDEQQDKRSANYHKWLTPEQFGKQFGPSDGDLETITAWLRARGFQVTALSKGRTSIEFSGSASQVQSAFHTAIHKYAVNGEEHWANASDPSIPSALAPAVKGILTLHNFPRRSYSTVVGTPMHATPRPDAPLPWFTFTPQQNTYYGLGPTDFATIYNLLPLWNAGIDGMGQTIAIVGESNIYVSDIENFRSLFGLPANDPQVILNGPDPGVDGDETEAILDVSWSGAVAKNATIDLVVSASTEASLGVDLSALYIVDNNVAPVMSESYGECESTLGNAGNAFYNALWQQAAAQGITVLISAGDGGSAGCDNFDSESGAVYGLAVSGFASTPYNVAVGGTDFNQTPATASTYWSATNDATTGASAKSYIPETTWNDSCAGLGIGGCTDSVNGDLFNIVAGSGGPSSCSAIDESNVCSGYSKPSWQTGTGVPTDGVRDLPDVSMFASNGFNNSFYIICEADAGFFGSQETCSLTNFTFVGVGGTSASAPAFAGIMALVNQKMAAQGLSARQGNANYVLYQLAAQNGASCNSSTAALTGNSCIFYDITQGNNSVPCNPDTPDCGPIPINGLSGVLVDPNNPGNPAWLTTTGYDTATGLGSVNADNLVEQWSSVSFTPTTTTLTNLSPVSITHGQAVSVSATVAPQSGSGTPTGAVALMATPTGQSLGAGVFPLNNGVASGTTTLLPGGTYNVSAHYAGDSTFGASDSAPVQVTVGKESSETQATLVAYDYTTGTFYQTNTIPYGTIFFLRSDVTNGSGTSCAPNPQQTQSACPTGTVSFTSNGKTLDAGTYALNTQAYVEDQTLSPEFTSLGSYALGALYSGDNSFNASSTTLNAIVTQAPTFPEPEVVGLSPSYNGTTTVWIGDSGQAFSIDVPVYAWSIQQAPTGTISILANGTPTSGTISYKPRNGSFTGNYSTGSFYWAYLAGYLNLAIDTPGNYTFTASYNGDQYYLPSQGQYPMIVQILDTTFNIASPISNVTIAAPGQSGTATVNLVGTDNFFGTINIGCTLPAAMTEATCPAVNANMGNSSVAAQLTITTTAPHAITSDRRTSLGWCGFGVVAGVFLWAMPYPKRGTRRWRLPLALLLFGGVALIVSCGSGSSTPPPQMDPGTPAGTYTVNVTAVSSGITRTASFNVTVQ
ncbi:MAG: protease pro-enzyme activation domain-containing protein [Terriglobales bacterium]